MVLNTYVHKEFNNAVKVNNLKKKSKLKKNKGKQFNSVHVLHDCNFFDQDVVDERSADLKATSKIVVSNFLDKYQFLLFKNCFCNEKIKFDGSMKAHFYRYLLYFHNVKQRNSTKDYFSYDEHYNFAHNNVNSAGLPTVILCVLILRTLFPI